MAQAQGAGECFRGRVVGGASPTSLTFAPIFFTQANRLRAANPDFAYVILEVSAGPGAHSTKAIVERTAATPGLGSTAAYIVRAAVEHFDNGAALPALRQATRELDRSELRKLMRDFMGASCSRRIAIY